jgi:hypothetical protein
VVSFVAYINRKDQKEVEHRADQLTISCACLLDHLLSVVCFSRNGGRTVTGTVACFATARYTAPDIPLILLCNCPLHRPRHSTDEQNGSPLDQDFSSGIDGRESKTGRVPT